MTPMDQLLEEYLRVINSKDDEIHKLIRKIETERFERKRQIDQYAGKIQKIQCSSRKSDEEIQQLKDTIQGNTNRMDNLVKKNDDLTSKLAQHAEALQNSETRNKEQLDQFQRERVEWQQKCEALKRTIEEGRHTMEKATDTARETASKLTILEQRYLNLQEEQKLAQESYAKELANKDQVLADAKKECTLRSVEEQKRANKAEEELASLRNSLDMELSRSKGLESNNAELKKFNESLQGRLNELITKEHALSKELKDSIEKGEHLEREREKMRQEDAAKSREIARLLEDSRDRAARFERLTETFENTKEIHEAKLSSSAKEIRILQESIVKVQGQLQMRDMELSISNSTLEKERDRAQEEIASLREKLALATSNAEKFKSESERLFFELKTEQQKGQLSATQHKYELDNEVRKKDEALSSLESLRQQLGELQKDHTERLRVLGESKKETEFQFRTEQAEKRRDFESQLLEANKAIESLKSQLTAESQKRDSFQTLAVEREKSIRILQEERDQLAQAKLQQDHAIKNLETEKLKVLESLSKSDQELARLRSDLMNSERRSTEIALEKDKLELILKQTEASLTSHINQLTSKTEEGNRLQETLKATIEKHQATVSLLNESEQKRKESEIKANLQEGQITKLEWKSQKYDEMEKNHLKVMTDLKSEFAKVSEENEMLNEKISNLEREADRKNSQLKAALSRAKEVENLAVETADEINSAFVMNKNSIREGSAVLNYRAGNNSGENAALPKRPAESNEFFAQASQRKITRDIGLPRASVEAFSGGAVYDRRQVVEFLEKDRSRLENELQDSKQKLASVESTLAAKERKYIDCKSALRDALDNFSKYKEETNDLRKQLERDVAAAAKIKENAQTEKARTDSLLAEYERKLRKAERIAQESTLKAERSAQRAEDAESNLLDVRGDYEKALIEAKERHRQRYEDREEASISLEEELKHAQRELQRTKKTLKMTEENIKRAQDELSTVNSKLQKAQMDTVRLFSEECEDMKRFTGALFISFFSSLRAILGDAIGELLRENESIRHHTHQELRRKVLLLQTEMESLAAQHDVTLKRIAAEHHRELADAKLSHEKALSEFRTEMEERDASDRKKYCLEFLEKNEQLRNRTLELEAARIELNKYRNRIDEKSEELRAFEKSSQVLNDKLTKENQALRSETSEARKRASDAEKLMKEQEEGENALSQEVSSLRLQLENMERAIDAERQTILNLHDDIAKEVEARESALAENMALKSQLEQLKRRFDIDSQRISSPHITGSVNAGEVENHRALALRETNDSPYEKRKLEHRVQTLDEKVISLNRKIEEMQKKESDLINQLQSRKGEISSYKERCANLESLKNITEATLLETQKREQDLLAKIEDLRNGQQLLQLCFDKQQEQLEIGRRLRNGDLKN